MRQAEEASTLCGCESSGLSEGLGRTIAGEYAE